MSATKRNILEIDGAPYNDRPHAWIQWKGTDVCMDVYCDCGKHLHADGDFVYAIKCMHCQRVYQMGSHIAMHELTPQEVREWDGCTIVELTEPV